MIAYFQRYFTYLESNLFLCRKLHKKAFALNVTIAGTHGMEANFFATHCYKIYFIFSFIQTWMIDRNFHFFGSQSIGKGQWGPEVNPIKK